jgi:hypothetical protein
LQRFRPAIVLGALALAIHLVASVVQWSWLGIEHWRLSRALVDTAKAAQLPDAGSAAAAAPAIARPYAGARHRTSQAAPGGTRMRLSLAPTAR